MPVNAFGDPVEAEVNAFGDPVEAAPMGGVLNKNATPEGELPMVATKEKPSQVLPWHTGVADVVERAGAGLLNLPMRGMDMGLKALGLTGLYNPRTVARFSPREPGQPPPELAQTYSPEEQLPFVPHQQTISPKFANSDIDPVNRFLENMVGGLSTPGGIVTAPFVAAKPVQAYYLSQTIPGAIESGQQALQPGLDSNTRTEAILNWIANTLFSGGLAHGMTKPATAVPSGLEGKDIPFSFNPLKDIPTDTIGPERQLADRPPETRFAASPSGEMADLSQLTELERLALMRKNMYQEQTKRPYQPTYDLKQPTIEQPILSPYQTQPGNITPAYQAHGEPKLGGQVSFDASAPGIPNALQQAQQGPEPFLGPDVAKEMGLIRKEWDKSIPGLGGKQSFTDPKTGLTVEGVSSEASLSEVEKKMRSKLSEREGGRGTKFYSNPIADPEFWKNASQDVKDFISKVKEEMGGFVLSGPRIALSPTESGFKNAEKQVDAQQLYNRLRNKVPQSEWEFYKDKLPQEGKVSPFEAAKLMQENGPRVEVRKFGVKPAATSYDLARERMNQAQHDVETNTGGYYRYTDDGRIEITNTSATDEVARGAAIRFNAALEESRRLEVIGADQTAGTGETAHWSSIAPKAEKDMPGYVELAVVKPLKRELTDREYKAFQDRAGMDEETTPLPPRLAQSVGEQFPSTHSFPPNTLAFARGYMETTKEGKKVFHVIEVQSDWAQQIRNEGAETFPLDSEEAQLGYNRIDEPLLKHYERLALKAAIEHAKKEGADAVAVQDAESAMMMEGHDRLNNPNAVQVFDTELEAKRFASGYGDVVTEKAGDKWVVRAKPSQEPGMRLHYDRTLPKIMEELTGQKGERAEFGEHRMAMFYARQRNGIGVGEGVPRKDLIFRNPDNTPKTSISARLYNLVKDDIKPTLFESDKPAARAARLYTNPLFDPEFWKGTGKDLATVTKEGKKKFQNWVDKAYAGERPLGWSPYWSATKEERAKALLGDSPHRVLADKEIGAGRQPGEAKPAMAGVKEFTSHIRNAINNADKNLMVKDVIIDWMDDSKGKFNGPLMQHVVWPMDDNFQVELNLRDKYTKPLALVMKDEKLTQQNGERIGVALINAQEGGRQRLLDSGVTEATIKNVTASLTSGEKRAINVINNAHEDMFPLVQKVAEKFGVKVNKVDNYLSWQRDYKKWDAPPSELALPKANESATVDDVTKWIADSYPNRGTKTASGFTIERKPGAKTPIKVNAFEVFDRHIRDASHFVAMAEHLKDVGEIVRNEKFASKYGKLGQSMMLDWLNTVARQGRSVNSIPLMDALRKRASVGILAYRLASQVIHSVNVPFGVMRAGPEYWRRGMVASLKGDSQVWLRKNLGETFERGGGEPGIMELDTSELSTKTAPRKIVAGAVKGGFAIQRYIDQKVAQATAIGVYQKLLAEKGKDASRWMELPVDKDALAQARVLSRRAVASPLYKDTPRMLNRGSVAKMFFQFQNTFLDQWSNIRHDLPEYMKHDKTEAAKLAVAVVAMLAMESAIKIGIKTGLQKSVGYQPKHDDSVWHKGMEELVKRVPGGGQLMTALLYGGTGIPMVDLMLSAVRTGRSTYEALASEDRKSANLAGVQAATAVAEIAGVPGANQASEVIQNKLKAEYFKSHENRVKDVAQKKFGKRDNLTTTERVAAEKKYSLTKERMTRGEETSSGRAALKNNQDRGEALQKRLDKSEIGWLTQNQLRVPGHADKVMVRGVSVTLDKVEMERFEGYLLSEYKEAIKRLQNPGFASLPSSGKKSVFEAQVKSVNARARAKIVNEINQK